MLYILMVMVSIVSVFLSLVCPYSDTLADLAAPSLIKFGIESKYSCPLTSTDAFMVAIGKALQDMKNMCSNVTAQL